MSDPSDKYVINENWPEHHRSGFVSVVGRPNVGKSTLMNALLDEKLAIVTPKPQTTRRKQLGILTREDRQIVFVDTPGVHLARNELGEYMISAARGALEDADILLFIADVSEMPNRADEVIAEYVTKLENVSVLLVLNKIDLISDQGQLEERCAAYHALVPDAYPIRISATEGTNVERIEEYLFERLPLGPRYYPAEQLTDTFVRDNAAEIIREQALLQYEHEIPHSLHVEVAEFKERSDDMTYIQAIIYVERDSQKRILIGKKGQALKSLGQAARNEIQELTGTRVYLDLWVKVAKNWRSDAKTLRRFGYDTQD